MTTKIIRGAEVNRPEPSALTSSVKDHATVVQKSDFGLRNNAGLWPSYNCLDTLVPTTICPDPLAAGKSFGTAEWIPAFEFAVQGGAQCLAVGLDEADQKSEVKRVFDRNVGKGIEQVLKGIRFEASDSGAAVQWDAPVDLTTSGMTPIAALSALEGYAAAVYAGKPTIHMPRAVASMLGDRIVWEGDKAFTRLGSKVAMGGGYDSDVKPTGSFDIYATGEVYIEESEDILVQTYVIPGDGSGTGSDQNGLQDNTVLTLAEQAFRVGVDCFVAKATAKAW